MKRFLSLLTAVILLLPILSIGTFAAADISVTGASSAYPGDDITVTVKLDTGDVSNAFAVMFDAVFDAEQIEYKSSGSVLTDWKVSESKKSNGVVRFLFECDAPKETIDGKTLIKLNFELSDSLAKGETVAVSLKNISIASIDKEEAPADVTYSVNITKKSSDATLYSMSVGDVTLSPAFSSDVTSYTATFDYRTTALKINYKTNDSKASVKVSGNGSFKVGKNTITLTVTAEDGTTKKYTITATMKENPTPLSDDNTISKITLSAGTISPAFKSNVYNYTITVPSDTKNITITPTASDSKATVNKKMVGITTDKTTVTLVCTAEDGSQRNYVFVVLRDKEDAPADTGIVTDEQTQTEDTTPVEDTAPPATDIPVITPVETENGDETAAPPTTDNETDTNDATTDTRPVYEDEVGMSKPVPLWSLLLFSIISLILGVVISAFIFKRKF